MARANEGLTECSVDMAWQELCDPSCSSAWVFVSVSFRQHQLCCCFPLIVSFTYWFRQSECCLGRWQHE